MVVREDKQEFNLWHWNVKQIQTMHCVKNIYFVGIILWCQKLPLPKAQQQIWKDIIRLMKNIFFENFYFWFLLKVKNHSWNFVIASLGDGCLFFGISYFWPPTICFLFPFSSFLNLLYLLFNLNIIPYFHFFNNSLNRPQQLD